MTCSKMYFVVFFSILIWFLLRTLNDSSSCTLFPVRVEVEGAGWGEALEWEEHPWVSCCLGWWTRKAHTGSREPPALAEQWRSREEGACFQQTSQTPANPAVFSTCSATPSQHPPSEELRWATDSTCSKSLCWTWLLGTQRVHCLCWIPAQTPLPYFFPRLIFPLKTGVFLTEDSHRYTWTHLDTHTHIHT